MINWGKNICTGDSVKECNHEEEDFVTLNNKFIKKYTELTNERMWERW
jgi:hypothetical protein